GGSKYVIFLSEPYITDFMSVTYIFAITGTYHLPRGITFAPQALGVPRGGRLQFQKRKAARRNILWRRAGKNKLACFYGQLP
ncbi:MAG: hypothetical protein PHG33_00545, partial [Bacteroidales bacterium]|nr:hypothetical protein [Bacteroidales bacterium]